MAQQVHKPISTESERLLRAVAEHLRQPLLLVRNAAELADKDDSQQVSTELLKVSADSGLLLIEHYLTWQRYVSNGEQQSRQQIGLSAVMRDVQTSLASIADVQQTRLDLYAGGKYGPVLTDVKLLSSGLSALGLAFIEAAQSHDQSEVVLGVHKTRWGLVAGVYSPKLSIRADSFARSKQLAGTARQLLPGASHSPMSGVAVAQALFTELSVKLRPSRYKGMDGLAVTLAPSPQLSLL